MITLNVWAIILSAIASMAIGGLWYSPLVWGKKYMALLGIDPADCEKLEGMTRAYILTFISTLIAATGLNAAISGFGITEAFEGAIAGALIWVAFALTTAIPAFVFSIKKEPWLLFVINNGHQLIAWIVVGIIMTLLK